MNENDSHEYYLDENDRLFKLDNAASFRLDLSPAARALAAMSGSSTMNGIYETEAEKYEVGRESLISDCGQDADEPYIEIFRRFAKLEMSVFDDAIGALDKNYPTYIVGYLYDFIWYRIKTCRQYIEELGK